MALLAQIHTHEAYTTHINKYTNKHTHTHTYTNTPIHKWNVPGVHTETQNFYNYTSFMIILHAHAMHIQTHTYTHTHTHMNTPPPPPPSPPPIYIQQLCMRPTPIHKWNLPGVPSDFQVWVKRDDLTGSTLSGNKVIESICLNAGRRKIGSWGQVTCIYTTKFLVSVCE